MNAIEDTPLSMEIPYAIEPRPDTGFSNAALGVWLFLASETMLFGALFSSYVLLRTGAPEWPRGWQRLDAGIGLLETILLAASGVTMLAAVRATQQGARTAGRRALAITAGLALLFLIVELLAYAAHLRAGEVPSRDTFWAIYFALTGVHALHVTGGLVVLTVVAVSASSALPLARLAARTETVARYWWFVDVVWLALFVICYLT